MRDISVRCDGGSAYLHLSPRSSRVKTSISWLSQSHQRGLINHLSTLLSESPPNRGSGCLAKAPPPPTKGT